MPDVFAGEQCPHCEIRLKPHESNKAVKVCGICGEEFTDPTVFAKELLKSQGEKKTNLAIVDTDELAGLLGWKFVLSLIGIPVEEESYGVDVFPWVSLSIVVICIALAIVGVSAREALAIYPENIFGYGGLTFISYSFVHGDWGHLIFNLLFLWPFMDNVEEHIGHFRTLLLFFASAVAAAALHLMFTDSDLPLVGLSGVCFAYAVLYCCLFPRYRFLLAVPMVAYLMPRKRFRVRAWSLMVFFLLMELTGVFSQLNGVTNVSHLGHLGGAIAGLIAFLMWRNERVEL